MSLVRGFSITSSRLAPGSRHDDLVVFVQFDGFSDSPGATAHEHHRMDAALDEEHEW